MAGSLLSYFAFREGPRAFALPAASWRTCSVKEFGHLGTALIIIITVTVIVLVHLEKSYYSTATCVGTERTMICWLANCPVSAAR